MAKKPASEPKEVPTAGKPSALVDTRVIYCGDNRDQLSKLPDECVDLVYIYPASATPKKREGELDFMDVWYPIQVKQKDKVGRPDIDAFEAVMMREDRIKGFFVAFDYSTNALHEIDAFFRKSGKAIVALTIKDLLEEQIAYKLS